MSMKKATKTKIYIGISLIAIFILLMLFLFSGDNFDLLLNIVKHDLSNDQLRDKLNDFGWRGYITIVLLSCIQVVCAFLPAEPVQVLAGLTFGFPIGLLCCWAGVYLGNTIIYLLQKTFGDQLRGFFIKKLHLDLETIAKSSKCILIIFILYFLPAIPYGMICFFAATTNMSYRRYITVTMLGALPSVCIGVGLGYMTIVSDWVVSVCIFATLIILLIIMWFKRDVLFSKVNDYAGKHKKSSRTIVRKPNMLLFNTLYFVFRIYFRLCGIRVKAVNKTSKPESPAIVLCNHGSFIDFIFAATLLRKYKPNFVIARLYFYNKYLRYLLERVGGFPKSMFATDIESTKNCIKVLNDNGLLTMMPEARLSTVGRFEDIQSNTYSFIKKAAVPVYTIKFSGDYFADPKWGKGFRKGAIVEAELDILYTADEINNLSVEEIKKGVEDRLYYDEFQWLKNRENIEYHSKKMAEGLENILNTCPKCKGKHTLTTKKDKIYCEKCGYLTSIDNRYSFKKDFRFENIAQWYDWQKELLKKEIAENKDFSLVSEVELRVPGNGNGLTRSAGKGECTLNREGLTYSGTKDGEKVEINFSIYRVYRLLFGAGENFEIYNNTEILYFVPKERRSAVDWYMASMILNDEATEKTEIKA